MKTSASFLSRRVTVDGLFVDSSSTIQLAGFVDSARRMEWIEEDGM
jgi:hypothetical protein